MGLAQLERRQSLPAFCARVAAARPRGLLLFLSSHAKVPRGSLHALDKEPSDGLRKRYANEFIGPAWATRPGGRGWLAGGRWAEAVAGAMGNDCRRAGSHCARSPVPRDR